MSAPKNIAIICKQREPASIELLKKLLDTYIPKHVSIYLEPETFNATHNGHENIYLLDKILPPLDVTLVFGGDGTFIHAASLFQEAAVPILGVNLGSLGFLTEFTQEEFLQELPSILKNGCTSEERMRLEATLLRGDRVLLTRSVINDVVISRSAIARIAILKVSIDNQEVTKIRSDGIIVSTPTGSTAYNLSSGGPIVSTQIQAMCFLPLCPHSLSQRPLVISADRDLEIELISDNGQVYFTLDGQAGAEMKQGDKVVIRAAKYNSLVVPNAKRTYFSLLREKLQWGDPS